MAAATASQVVLDPTTDMYGITFPMQSLLSSKEQGRKDFKKPTKPCHVGIHCIALAEHSQMSTHVPGFQSFLRVFATSCTEIIIRQQHMG